MKAMIFAAGMGTRLQPITNKIPKALVKINGITLLEIVIQRLKKFGFNDIIINVHHFSEQVIKFIKEKNNFEINIQFSNETGQLLDTGGGLKKAEWFLKGNESFLMHNVDVLSDIDLKQLVDTHNNSNALATLAVRKRTTSRYLLFDQNNILKGWKNVKTGEYKFTQKHQLQSATYQAYAFSGIHIIESDIFNYITEQGKFSIIDLYLKIGKEHKIMCYDHSKTLWFDVGKREILNEAEKIFDITKPV